jgi:hypothetical protein
MKKAVWLLVAITTGTAMFGCNKGNNQPAPAGSSAQKIVLPEAAKDKDLALKFLQGVQSGDKKIMYEADNLTDELVNESREKLIHPAKYNLTDAQRKDFEHILRTSGEIDFFAKKMAKIFPKSSSIQVTQSAIQGSTATTRDSTHTLKIVYADKAEAMSDKTGKQVKEMTLQLQHSVRLINGRLIHEISFNSKDFEKIADKDFTVQSYF